MAAWSWHVMADIACPWQTVTGRQLGSVRGSEARRVPPTVATTLGVLGSGQQTAPSYLIKRKRGDQSDSTITGHLPCKQLTHDGPEFKSRHLIWSPESARSDF